MNILEYIKQEELKALLWAKRHMVAALVIAFSFGLFVSGLWGAFERWEIKKLEKQLVISNTQNKRLLNKQAEMTLTSERLRATNQSLTESISEQERENQELERGLNFYRQLMDPNKVKEGLVLQNFSINPIDEDTLYRLQFTFVQYDLKRSLVRAELNFSLKGVDLSKAPKPERVISFTQMQDGQDTKKKPAKLSFRYFQEVEQLISIPENFSPKAIVIKAKLRSKKQKSWQHEIPWPSSSSDSETQDEQPQQDNAEDNDLALKLTL